MRDDFLSESRRLGTNEQLWYRLGELDSNNFVMLAKLCGSVDLKKLKSSLRALVDAQPILKSRVITRAGKKYLATFSIEELPIQVIDRETNDHWQAVVENELNDSVENETDLLWRLVVLHGEKQSQSEILVCFNHLLADGRTGQLFFDFLLKSMSDESYVIPKKKLTANFEAKLEKLNKRRERWGRTYKACRAFLSEGKTNWRQLRPSFEDACTEAHTKLISRQLNEAQLEALRTWSRKHKSSVTASLAVSLAACFKEDLGEGQSTGISIAIDTRPLCGNESESALGYYVTTANLQVDDELSLSDQLRVFKENLDDQNNSAQMKFDAFYRGLALRFKKEKVGFKKLVQSKATNAALLTNLGKLDMQKHYGDLELKHCFHIPAVHLLDAPYLSLATTSCHGEMQLSFTYPGHLLNEELINKWADGLLEILTDLA